jgi:FkbH-like protein
MPVKMKWLPASSAWSSLFDSLKMSPGDEDTWQRLVALASYDIDFVECAKLDRFAQKLAASGVPRGGLQRVRLALLGSSTLRHLLPGIRVAGLRHGLWIDVFEADYGLYLNELLDHNSKLHLFKPQVLLLALDAPHLLKVAQGNVEDALEHLRTCWGLAKASFSASVIQQTALPIFPDLFGNNEHRLNDSPQAMLQKLNQELRSVADADGVSLFAIDKYVAIEGVDVWHDPALWYRTKQEVHPTVAPLYGEYIVRLVAALRGRTAKCLVLDLDNTLWGGVIGDDGLEGIALGEGNAVGEAYLAFQRYVLSLKERGVILAVCSKNEEATALLPFTEHVDMILKRTDIACFIANWEDKATNLRQIASRLNIGVDSLVFVDDNPFERDLIRKELPEVSVPEMPEDPALYVQCLSRAGYFEGVVLTEDDRERAEQYRSNVQRDELRQSSTDMESYLRGMQMEMLSKPFDRAGLKRIVQLANKTNQFNLTTQRYSEEELEGFINSEETSTWQIRLRDRFGDNGVISLLIGSLNEQCELVIATWLMSCRVLGRQVEEASLNMVVARANSMGANWVVGEYKPSAKNGMVRDLYERLGFIHVETDGKGNSRWRLDVRTYNPKKTYINVLEEVHG